MVTVAAVVSGCCICVEPMPWTRGPGGPLHAPKALLAALPLPPGTAIQLEGVLRQAARVDAAVVAPQIYKPAPRRRLAKRFFDPPFHTASTLHHRAAFARPADPEIDTPLLNRHSPHAASQQSSWRAPRFSGRNPMKHLAATAHHP